MSKISVQVKVDSTIDNIWRMWSEENHIKNWYFASDDWYVPSVDQDFAVGGHFTIRMESKDKSMGFDFAGTYLDIKEYESIVYTLEDDREVLTTFTKEDMCIVVTQVFDVEDTFSSEMQREGWQSILNNFKKYVENDDL